MTTLGRPKSLGAGRRSLNVLVPADDFNELRRRADQLRHDHPGYSMGDLVRSLLREGMDRHKMRQAPEDPHVDRLRRLRGAARTVREVLRELEEGTAA